MRSPVCVTCQCELLCQKNDTGVVVMSGSEPYQLWSADTWKCPGCGVEIVTGFGVRPLAVRHHEKARFERLIEDYRRPDERLEYVYAWPTPKLEVVP